MLLDALRGFALFGVLLVNLRTLSLYAFLPAAEKAALPTAGVDTLLLGASAIFVDGAFITLFSILFGVGFAMQMQRAADAPGAVARYARRLLVLLFIGVLHAWLLWWGDILRYYAIFGLLLLPLARLPGWLLVAVGTFVAVALPPLLQPLLPPLLPPQLSSAESAARSLSAFSSDQWSEMLDANFARDLRMRIAVWSLPAFVFGRLLIGAALGRSGVLVDPDSHLRFWRGLLFVGILLLVAISWLKSPQAQALLTPGLTPVVKAWQLGALRNAAPLLTGGVWLAGFVLLFRITAIQRWLSWLVPVGRMALSNYLAQSILGVALFYGVGLGIGPQFGMLGIVVATVLIFLLQAMASAYWLRHFRYGPVEWLWRSLSYLKAQPMRVGGDLSCRPKAEEKN